MGPRLKQWGAASAAPLSLLGPLQDFQNESPHPLDGGDIQMRQVCTHPDRQGEGLGRTLVTAAEEMARQMGYKRMVLHGRESAAGFYRKLGYLTDGVRFYELNIPHLSFHKTLV